MAVMRTRLRTCIGLFLALIFLLTAILQDPERSRFIEKFRSRVADSIDQGFFLHGRTNHTSFPNVNYTDGEKEANVNYTDAKIVQSPLQEPGFSLSPTKDVHQLHNGNDSWKERGGHKKGGHHKNRHQESGQKKGGHNKGGHHKNVQKRVRQSHLGVFDVREYGAQGDGVNDDTLASKTAMEAACRFSIKHNRRALLMFPDDGDFFIGPISLVGPCGPGLIIKIDGTVSAPQDMHAYPYPEETSSYFPYTSGFLTFKNITGLAITGHGAIEGHGETFWRTFRNRSISVPIRPFGIRIMYCADVLVEGITIRNPPMYHIFVYSCDGLTIRNFSTDTPSNSPNTDSLKLLGIRNTTIENCSFHGGDDDISIVAVGDLVASNITVRNIYATAGHGISIGSLGWDGQKGCVSDVYMQNMTLVNLTNGLRIKSWQGGLGIVRNIRYEDITLLNSRKAIVLNQFYCDAHQPWACAISPTNVAFHNISYSNISGAVSDSNGIVMKCSDTVPCTSISLHNINIVPSEANSTLYPIFRNVLASSADNVISPLPRNKTSYAKWGKGLPNVIQQGLISDVASHCGFVYKVDAQKLPFRSFWLKFWRKISFLKG